MATSIHGHFLWHELMTSDPAAAGAFYKKVVGWWPVAWDKDSSYTVLRCGKAQMGGLMEIPPEARQMGVPPCWMGYVGVTDVDETTRQVRALGGTVHKEPWDIPGVGRMAVVADPQGATFAVFHPADMPAGMPAPTYPVAVGDFSWHELATTDPDAAVAFYRDLFGWEKTGEFDMGPMGMYRMFGLRGVDFGGIYKKPAEMPAPSHWLLYAKVHDVARAAAAAGRAGGTVVNGPMEVPGGDWIAQIIDPQGAAFAVHAVKPAAVAAPKRAAKAAPAKKAASKKASPAPAAPKAAAKKSAAKKASKKKAAAKKASPKKAATKKAAAKKAATKKAATKKAATRKPARRR